MQDQTPHYSGIAHEPARLAVLRGLQLIDGVAEPSLDRITRIAQRLFEVPIALVSLIDADRQWFKSRCGLTAESTPRDQAFCNYTIEHDSVFVVPDARADRRFSSNPLVTGAPHIRFYAGAPLTVAPGIRLGSLCLIDTRPRDFHPADMQRLAALATQVVGEIWLLELEKALGTGLPASLPPALDAGSSLVEQRITGAQLRAARGLLKWSIAQLASAAGVSPATIKRIEAIDGEASVRFAISQSLRSTCEAEGIVFTGRYSSGAGGAALAP
ncbi:GAF domain-containing protein [Methylobacterium iners]|uniref:HTH cro/C1-type domain-containing protein n=1 Tax=Methylobacterium iners TaxID=418707 RepID=A0ABQ4S2R6_9HYPH|nr:GAF domain-containing protein [Methylobacterium iners]GJD96748.1 hypothetical protein OCOJLMKI_3973 [Methylobacterium iners]